MGLSSFPRKRESRTAFGALRPRCPLSRLQSNRGKRPERRRLRGDEDPAILASRLTRMICAGLVKRRRGAERAGSAPGPKCEFFPAGKDAGLAARHRARSRPSFWLSCHFPAGIRGRENSFPASRLGKSW
jgi:hypothetical protein